MESKRKTDDITFHIYAVHFFFSRLDYIMNYYEYIVLDAMDIFYVFYDILLLIKKFSGFVYLLSFVSGCRYRRYIQFQQFVIDTCEGNAS